ncbi:MULTISPECIES: DUF2272 domain-containing protein [unclassified Rhizobacter]|uniref:DUF2272 domain-containing protein n=1 Tax=unclassified Rhizobacter TaxID=2640088 RepID=UPI0007000850|nr:MULTISPECIES: DUF2272 domain-containing protein [unclassified Rhizobacter]KQU81348.1 hypothetical protein ASC88_00175 [Rhizobacter sp. Root29]KQW09300.1 hypothetical protein ASC98_24205 [Rhizobacter sp. Root1238]KRB18128.1 hypothetical protein ASE08_24640 [Rhizobacter sp. Root16D2]
MRPLRDTHLFRATRLLLAALLVAGCVTRGPVVPTTVGPERIARMLQIAEAEWQRWGSPRVGTTADGAQCAVLASGDCAEVDDGCGREMTAALCPVVNGYWASLGPGGAGGIQRHTCPLADQCEARWSPEWGPPHWTPAWSAAFISAVLRRAGFSESEFRFGKSHADYIVAARDRLTSAHDVVPTPAIALPGDLICALREGARIAPAEIDRITAGETPTPMHCDLVVRVDFSARRLEAIGGNVQQAVSRSTVELDEQGRVAASPGAGRAWNLVMRLHTEPLD